MLTSVCIKLSGSLSRRVGKTTAAILAAAAISILAVAARAVTITNLTTNTVVFHDDFESGNLLSPSVGTWSVGSNVTVTNSTTPPNPGPAEGTFYARSFRDTQFVSGQGNMFANLSAAQTNPGDLIHMSAMLYVPNDGANARAVFALDDGNAGTNGRAIIRSDGTGNVIALGPGLASVDTELDYTADAWQRWELEYAVGGATFSVRVNGVSAGPFASFTAGQVSTGEIFNGAFNPAGSVFVDAVPESSQAGDYNGNGTVDAADYILWRNGGPLANEVDNPGTINTQDYHEWRSRFGNSSGSGSGATGSANAVPERASTVLAGAVAVVVIALGRRRRWRVGVGRNFVAAAARWPSRCARRGYLMKIFRPFCACVVALGCASVAFAAADVWDGNGAVPPTGIWDSGNNWSGDNTTPGNSDTATFNLAQTYAVNFAADPLAIQNLTVSAGTVTFQNSGGVQTLDVTSGGALDVFIGTATLNLGTSSNTMPVNLMVGDVLFVTSGGILNINAGSVVTVATTGALVINSGGRVNIGSGLTTGTLIANGNVTVNGGVLDHNAGAFTLAAGKNLVAQNDGNVSFIGAYTINGGSIYTVEGGADFSTTSSLTIGSTTNGTMTVDGADSTLAMGNLSVMTNGVGPGLVGTLTLSNGAVATQNGTSLGIGQTAFANTANLNVQSGAVLNSSATTFTVQSSGKLNVTGGGIVNVSGNLTVNSAGGTGGAIPGAEININGGAAALIQSGATTITVGHVATGTGAINIGTTTAGGTLTTGTGLFTINKTGTVTVGSGANTGTLNANGNVTIDGGVLTRDSGGTLALASGKTMTIQNAGRASFTGDYSTATNAIYNISGTSSKLETLSGGALSFNNGAQVNVAAGGLVSVAGNLTIVTTGASATLSIQGNNSAATIGGASSLTVGHATIGGAFINIGTTAGGATLTTGTGLFTINQTGRVKVDNNSTLNAVGNVTIDGGLLQIDDSSSFALSAGKTMTIQNGGRFSFANVYVAQASCIYSIIGANSKLEVDGLSIYGHDNPVNVSSGGSISSLSSINIGLNGTLLVDGSGSSATVTNLDASYWGTANVTFSNNAVGTFAGDIEMARGGTANVSILSGADLSVGGKLLLAAGGVSTNSATLNVNGAGSTITLSSDLTIGHSSTGTAAINIGTTNAGGTLLAGFGDMKINKTGTVTVGSGTNTGALDSFGQVRITGGLLQVGTGSSAKSSVMLLVDAGTLKGSGNVMGPVVNSSGVVSPGTPIGTLTFNGDYMQSIGGQLLIELASASTFDKIVAINSISLSGTLDVDLLGGFIPQSGSVFPIISSASGVSGSFDTVLPPTLTGSHWQLRYEPTSVSLQFTLVGDYNLNGTVDAADYVVWRKTLGTSGVPVYSGADGDGDGMVDPDDYGVWRAHFGNPVPGAGSGAGGPSLSQAAVPEPATMVLLMFAAAGWCLQRGRAAQKVPATHQRVRYAKNRPF